MSALPILNPTADLETDYPFGCLYHLPIATLSDDETWKPGALYDDSFGDQLSGVYEAALRLRYNISSSQRIRCISRDFDYACTYYMDHYSESLILASPDIHVHLVLEVASESVTSREAI